MCIRDSCYGYLDDELAARLVEDFLMHDDPCYEFALVALETNDVFPTFSDFPRGVYEKKIVLEHCGFIAVSYTHLDVYKRQVYN